MLISDNIKKLHNVWTSTKILKYFNLPFDLFKHMKGRLRTSTLAIKKKQSIRSIKYLLFLHRLEYLDDAFLIVVNIDAFKDFTIFTSSNFPDNFIVILLTVKDAP